VGKLVGVPEPGRLQDARSRPVRASGHGKQLLDEENAYDREIDADTAAGCQRLAGFGQYMKVIPIQEVALIAGF
jgi:hypothetical protein